MMLPPVFGPWGWAVSKFVVCDGGVTAKWGDEVGWERQQLGMYTYNTAIPTNLAFYQQINFIYNRGNQYQIWQFSGICLVWSFANWKRHYLGTIIWAFSHALWLPHRVVAKTIPPLCVAFPITQLTANTKLLKLTTFKFVTEVCRCFCASVSNVLVTFPQAISFSERGTRLVIVQRVSVGVTVFCILKGCYECYCSVPTLA